MMRDIGKNLTHLSYTLIDKKQQNIYIEKILVFKS